MKKTLKTIAMFSAALVVTCSINAVSLADELTVKGVESKNVRIFSFKEGKVKYEVAGNSRTVDLKDIGAIGLSSDGNVARAESAFKSGSFPTAIRLFKQSMDRAKNDDMYTLIQYRMMRAQDAGGEFTEAVKTYRRLLDKMPELAELPPTNLPKGNVTGAVKALDDEIKRARNARTRSVLQQLKNAVQSGGSVDIEEDSTVSTTTRNPRGTSSAEAPAAITIRGGTKLSRGVQQRITDLLAAKNADGALEALAEVKARLDKEIVVPANDWSLFFIYRGQAQSLKGQHLYAVADFMRVPIHYGDSKLVARALLEAAKSYGTLMGSDEAGLKRAVSLAESALKSATSETGKDDKVEQEAKSFIRKHRAGG